MLFILKNLNKFSYTIFANSSLSTSKYSDNFSNIIGKLEESFKITPNQEGFSWYVFDIAEDYKIIKKDIVSSNNYIEF